MLVAVLAVVAAVSNPGNDRIPQETQVHLGLSLRIAAPQALDVLRRAQLDPASPSFRHWISPEEFGRRFGQPDELCSRVASWLAAGGLKPTVSPNHIFIEAKGTAGQLSALLGVHLQRVAGQPVSVHVPDGAPHLPPWLVGQVIFMSGLDTRIKYHPVLLAGAGVEQPGVAPTFGPQDLRRFYDMTPLLDAGYAGQGQQLVVLGDAVASGDVSPDDIEYFLGNVSDSSASFSIDVLPNPQNDTDPEGIPAGIEMELDSEMQSVAAPGADSITLVQAPASEIFTTGINYIVSQLPQATAVSSSFGNCESVAETEVDGGLGELDAIRQLIVQGTMEGQTWSAAAGDYGANDCGEGPPAAVDFPASIPEIVALGGTQVNAPAWDVNDALTAYQQEVVWNQTGDAGSGATGGGISTIFPEPSYQQAFGFTGRSVPDIALIAGPPGVAFDPFAAGALVSVEGTSVSSPLSAGIFALLASRIGSRLGDVHSVIYALGAAQQNSGAVVFHDITSGNNSLDGVTGFSAKVGFDSVSGWGSLDVAALAAAWPGASDGGGVPGPSYDSCAIPGCDGGRACTTLPEGPSSCLGVCDPEDGGGCPTGAVCSAQSLFAPDGGGACVNGCAIDADCASVPGTACSCGTCAAANNPTAQIGDDCAANSDCTPGGSCSFAYNNGGIGLGTASDGGFSIGGTPDGGGYCTATCLGTGCCPAGSVCVATPGESFCLESCSVPGGPCGRRPGFICQPRGTAGGALCLPPCQLVAGFDDTCASEYGSSLACDVDSGICGGPPALDAGSDAGSDGGPVATDAGPVADAGSPDAGGLDAGGPGPGRADAGPADAGTTAQMDGGRTAGDGGAVTPASSGCGCLSSSGSPDGLFGIVCLLALLKRRSARSLRGPLS